MTLREQIELVLDKTDDRVLLNSKEITNVILNLMEKKIDERIESVENADDKNEPYFYAGVQEGLRIAKELLQI
jgi:hypothetical protein